MNNKISIPNFINEILQKFERSGFAAYVVGGCVRDHILGIAVSDYDITTNAKPDEVKKVFFDWEIAETGIKHGTLTVKRGFNKAEITTYRIDGSYSDNRHPDSVVYTNDIVIDLSRRDFTMNAVAYNPKTGYIDPFGGLDDIRSRIIKCVGNPDQRFREDTLRILRGARFAAVLGFVICDKTTNSAIKNANNLRYISGERVSAELKKMLIGGYFENIALLLPEILTAVIPELEPTINFDQKSPHHEYDIYTHSIKSVKYCKKEVDQRLAMLLHDIGKPAVCTYDETGRGHFYGHEKKSAEIAACLLQRLKLSGKLQKNILTLISNHGVKIAPNAQSVKHQMNKLGAEMFFKLLDIKRADNLSKYEIPKTARLENLKIVHAIANKIIQESQCFCMSDLDISGNDIVALGFETGPQIGIILENLLNLVIDDKIENTKCQLIGYVCSNFT